MKIELKEPYKSKWKSGYLRQSKIDGRRRVDLYNSNAERTTISYAKYLISVENGMEIPEGYEVDHIDDDCTNDELYNLQILSEEEHLKKTLTKLTTGRNTVTLICPVCNMEFQRELRHVTVENPKCSRQCNGKNISSTIDYDSVKKLLNDGLTDRQVSQELNISVVSVLNYRKLKNIKSNSIKNTIINDNLDDILLMLEHGFSHADIKRKYNISNGTFYRFLKKHNPS